MYAELSLWAPHSVPSALWMDWNESSARWAFRKPSPETTTGRGTMRWAAMVGPPLARAAHVRRSSPPCRRRNGKPAPSPFSSKSSVLRWNASRPPQRQRFGSLLGDGVGSCGGGDRVAVGTGFGTSSASHSTCQEPLIRGAPGTALAHGGAKRETAEQSDHWARHQAKKCHPQRDLVDTNRDRGRAPVRHHEARPIHETRSRDRR